MSEDKEFERYLQGQSELSQTYAQLPDAEPPAHLDAAILAEAHRAVGARPGLKQQRRWLMPLSMAASLLVAVMIGLQLPYLMRDASAPQSISEAYKPEARLDRAAPPAAGTQGFIARKPEESRGMLGEAPAAPPMEAKSAAPAPAASMLLEENRPMKEQAEPGQDKRLLLKKEAGAASNEAAVSDRMEAPASLGVAQEPMAAPAARMKARNDAVLSADAWLERVRQLIKEGRREDARKELKEFRQHYPNHPVPSELEIH